MILSFVGLEPRSKRTRKAMANLPSSPAESAASPKWRSSNSRMTERAAARSAAEELGEVMRGERSQLVTGLALPQSWAEPPVTRAGP